MKLIFDIGANVGDMTDVYSQKADTVVAFEPNPSMVEELTKRFFGNPNIIIDRRSLDNKVGTNILMTSPYAASLSTFSEEWTKNTRFLGQQWNEHIVVPTITIDSAIEYYGVPDYIKIDVEGYEYQVIKGLSMLLPNTVVCFEWVEEQLSSILSIITYVNTLGYKAFSYTNMDNVMWEEDLTWGSWEKLNFQKNIVPDRHLRWGMIYFKKERKESDRPFQFDGDIYNLTDFIHIEK